MASASYYNLVFNGAGNKTLAGNIGIAGAFTITAGTFVHNGQTVTYNGGDQTVLALTYSGLSFTGSTSGSTKTFSNGTTSIASQIGLTDTITLTGSSASNVTVQVTTPGSGGTASRVFYINASGKTVTISNMTIKGGDISGSSANGGGICINAGNLTLNSVVVSGSKAYNGGGIALTGTTSMTLTMTNCTVSNNTATYAGGGIYGNGYSTIILNNSTVSGNLANNYSGGIGAENTLTMTNCTVSNNTVTLNNGGGICFFGAGAFTMTNCTVTGNSSGGNGAGIYLSDDFSVYAYLTNTIVAYNYLTSNTYSDIYKGSSATLYGNYNILGYDLTGTGTGNVYYTYTSGMGDSLFASYNTIAAGVIYAPVLANNGGATYTVALATDSIAGGAGCKTGTYTSGSTTKYVFSTDGTTWYKVEDGTTTVAAGDVTEITTDQRGTAISGTPSPGSYFITPPSYYRTASGGVIGDWSTVTNWEVSTDRGNTWNTATVAPNASNSTSIAIQSNASITVDSSISIDQTTVEGTLIVSGGGGVTLTVVDGTGTDLTSSGTITVELTGTFLIGSGASADINSTFTVNGALSFDDTSGSDNGTLNVSTASITISVLSGGNGTFVYDGANQTVNSLNYYNLTLSGTGTKTAAGIVGVSNNLTVNSGVTYAIAASSITVVGTSDINGTLTISTGTFDSDGAFDATGGTVTFTGAGALNLSSTVTSLGTFTVGTGTVTYDGVSDQTIAAATYYNLTLDGGGTTQTAGGTITVSNNLTVNTGVTFAVDTYTVTVTGTSDINGTLTISTGTFDANGAFDATSGAVTFTDAGNLKLASTVTSLGTFTVGTSTITYDGGNQTVLAVTYYNLTLGGSGTKTAGGIITVSNNLTVNSGATFAVGTNTVTVTWASDINGTLTISTGTFDANDTFDATGGAVTFTGAGNLKLASTVTSLGTFTGGTGTVTYDGAFLQSIAPATYYNLTLDGGTKTLGGTSTVSNNLTVNSGATFAVGTNSVTVTGTSDINGTLTISTGTFDANGAFDATGGTVTFTGAGNLRLASTVTSLGTFTGGTGTVTYDGAAQAVLDANYYNLTLGGSGTKTISANFTVNNLTVAAGVTLPVGTYTVTVNGISDINGTVTISTGRFDANGAFDATGGAVTFTGAGNLNLGSTVTSLGTFTCSTSTVDYDGDDQNVAAVNYYNLTLSNSGTKTVDTNNTTIAGTDTIIPTAKVALTVTVTAQNKVYDGTTTATVSLTYNNIFTSYSSITVGYTTAAFASAGPGNNLVVTVSGLSISGTKAYYFVLASTTAQTTANITSTSSNSSSSSNTSTDPVNPINDGTLFSTDSSWRNSIDFGSSNSNEEGGSDGTGGTGSFGGTGGFGGTGSFGGADGFGNTNYNFPNGEYEMQNRNSYHGPNGEYGIQSSGRFPFNHNPLNFILSNNIQVGALAYNDSTSMLNHEFQLEDIDGIINFDAMTASTEKHPVFKTELDLLLEAI